MSSISWKEKKKKTFDCRLLSSDVTMRPPSTSQEASPWVKRSQLHRIQFPFLIATEWAALTGTTLDAEQHHLAFVYYLPWIYGIVHYFLDEDLVKATKRLVAYFQRTKQYLQLTNSPRSNGRFNESSLAVFNDIATQHKRAINLARQLGLGLAGCV